MAENRNPRGRLWDDVIPDVVVLPGRAPGRQEPQSEDLVFRRVPGTDYAVYSVSYGRDKLETPVTRQKAV